MEVGDIVYYSGANKYYTNGSAGMEVVIMRITGDKVDVSAPHFNITANVNELQETGRRIPPCSFKPGDKVKFKVDEWGWFRERPVTKKGTVDDVSIKVTSKSFYNITVSYLMENGYMYQSTTKTENELKKIH